MGCKALSEMNHEGC